MVNAIRYAEKFEGLTGTPSYTFPTEMMEYDPQQSYRQVFHQPVGASYSYDPTGTKKWPSEMGVETVRFKLYATTPDLISAAFDTMLTTLRGVGLGKLFTTNGAGERRWCYAKLAGRPEFPTGVKLPRFPQVICTFIRMSDWFGTVVTGTHVITTSQFVNFVVGGNAPTSNWVLRLRSNGNPGWAAGLILSVGSTVFTTSRAATNANHELKIDNERQQVLWSTNDGSSYTDDYANVILDAAQIDFLEFGPGNNSTLVSVSGGTNFNLDYSIYPAFY